MTGAGSGAGAFLISDPLILWTAGQAWRRPALPPLRGQYPGRGAVSRPSSEWGRVGPTRCDHQAGPEVHKGQMSKDRCQRTDVRRRRRQPRRPRFLSGVVKLGHGVRRPKTRTGQTARARAGSAPVGRLSSVLGLGERSPRRAGSSRPEAAGLSPKRALGAERRRAWFERLGPVGCTRYRALTSGLSTWWSTTALDETWFGGGFPA